MKTKERANLRTVPSILLLLGGLLLCDTAHAQRTATATATVVNGFVVAITVTDGGAGYTSPPAVTITGGEGSGARAVASVADGAVDKITVTDAGAGYIGTPDVLIAAPPPRVTISGLAPSGELTFDVPAPLGSYVYDVEWASTVQGPWSRSWDALIGIVPTSTKHTVRIPTFYRIAAYAVLFQEDFQSGAIDATKWTGASNAPVSRAVVVNDPLDTTGSNKVLSFTGWDCDLFTLNPVTSGRGRFQIHFDYLGLRVPESGFTLGAAFGIAEGLNQYEHVNWIAVTPGESASTPLEGGALITDGQWHTYHVVVDTDKSGWEFSSEPIGNTPFRLMLEDWSGAGGVAGDVYFDNIRVSALD